MGLKRRPGWLRGRKKADLGRGSYRRDAQVAMAGAKESHGSQMQKGRQERRRGWGFQVFETSSGLLDSTALPSIFSRIKERFREVKRPIRAPADGAFPGLKFRCPHFQPRQELEGTRVSVHGD